MGALASDRLDMDLWANIHSSKVELWPLSITQKLSGMEALRALMVSYAPISHDKKKLMDASLPNERGGFQAGAGKSSFTSAGIIVNVSLRT